MSALLTKDSKKILYTLYKEYLNRREHNISKRNSKKFSSAASIQENFFPDIPLEDIEESLRELGRNDFLHNFYADNTIWECYLTDHAIALLENQNFEKFLSVADFISKFMP